MSDTNITLQLLRSGDIITLCPLQPLHDTDWATHQINSFASQSFTSFTWLQQCAQRWEEYTPGDASLPPSFWEFQFEKRHMKYLFFFCIILKTTTILSLTHLKPLVSEYHIRVLNILNPTNVFVVCLQQRLSSQPGPLPSGGFINCLWANRPVFTELIYCVLKLKERSWLQWLTDLLRSYSHSTSHTA